MDKKNHVCIYLYTCVCVHICISTNKKKKSGTLFHKTYLQFASAIYQWLETTKKEKKNVNMRVSVSSGKHLSTWVGQTIHVYSIGFIAIYLLCSSPLQKCVLTLDDVMLQVQRIYVNSGSRGEGQGVKSCQTLQDLFTH